MQHAMAVMHAWRVGCKLPGSWLECALNDVGEWVGGSMAWWDDLVGGVQRWVSMDR